MHTKYSHLSDAELIQLHRYDVQGDELMDELWQRLEKNRMPEVKIHTRYVEEEYAL